MREIVEDTSILETVANIVNAMEAGRVGEDLVTLMGSWRMAGELTPNLMERLSSETEAIYRTLLETLIAMGERLVKEFEEIPEETLARLGFERKDSAALLEWLQMIYRWRYYPMSDEESGRILHEVFGV